MKVHVSTKTHMLQIVLDEKSKQECLGLNYGQKFSNLHLDPSDFCDHITIYHPYNGGDDRYPLDLDRNVEITPIGYVDTSYVTALVVAVVQGRSSPMFYQAGGRRLLHITLGCAPTVKPVASNDAILSNAVKILSNRPNLSGVVRFVKLVD